MYLEGATRKAKISEVAVTNCYHVSIYTNKGMSDPRTPFWKLLCALFESATDTYQIESRESELSLFLTEWSKTKQAAKQFPLQEE